MRMASPIRKIVLITSMASLVVMTTSTFASAFPETISRTKVDLPARLAACASIPNGRSIIVVATTRMFINLPKEIYPNLKLKITRHGATAGDISNAGAPGYAFGARGKPDCWSHYLDFELVPSSKSTSGRVDIGSKSGISGVADYLIHVKVVRNPSDAKASTKGVVNGRVLLGPTCPVERIPPDPACAPKPYKTVVAVFRSASPTKTYLTVPTDAAGRFKASLSAGWYLLRAKGGSPLPHCAETKIKVLAGRSANAVVTCDTGIR
ncbi:hypothetical protein GALL_401710 [mine drainage metagenome]|uniref:Carboxypeptidase regulatory-like domain-containing protein n=1 Tax=mine drainage metagenome TaxID=410659 RepID=A0A1J5Q477_9ZZZZ